MNFDDLQKNWQSQPVNIATDTLSVKKGLQTKWQKHQRKLLIRNLFMTIGFILALSVIGWVYVTFRHKYSWPFVVSIATMYLLMIVFLMVTWRGYGFKKEYLDISSTDYIGYQIQKLNWQRRIITFFTPVYSVLLWLMLMMYILEITKGGTLTFKVIALSVTTLYILGVSLWNRFFKQKKQLAKIDEMIAELESIRLAFN